MAPTVSDLEKKIIEQVEFYFGDVNMSTDPFMQRKTKENDGWLGLKVLLKFRKLASLSRDPDVIVAALRKSESKLVVVSDNGKSVRRNPEMPIPTQDYCWRTDLLERTAIMKGFPRDSVNQLVAFLQPYNVEKVSVTSSWEPELRGTYTVVLKDIESCKKFVELESLMYDGHELIRFRKLKVEVKEEKEED